MDQSQCHGLTTVVVRIPSGLSIRYQAAQALSHRQGPAFDPAGALAIDLQQSRIERCDPHGTTDQYALTVTCSSLRP